ncbi:lactonase family protein [Streptomyces sp. NPDC046866]|uniref:lactonase family protein n=1 Tax=Streptomyces sp. NPDC046866 TaxID=3154921 RepID=UPI00345467B3
MVEGGSTRAYIGSFTSGGGRGITTAAVDPASGALTPLDGVADGLPNPAWLALAPGGGVLYALSETDEGAVAAYRPTPEGLTPLGRPVPSGGRGPTHLSVAGGRLLAAHYGSGTVSSLPLGADGTPGGPPSVLAHRGAGPDRDRQQGPHAHQVLPDPSGRWVLSVDLGTDSVRVCSLAPGSGELRLHAETALRAGSGPRHLAFHPAGGVVYVLHELEPQLTVCRWDAAEGRLVPVGEVSVLPADAPSDPRPYPSVPVVSPDGRFLRAAVRGADLVVTLSLADGAEKPQPVDSVQCGGSWPRDLVTDPSGRRLYVCNEWSGDVTWFEADPVTGRLQRAGRLEVPAAACLVLA